MIILSQKRRNKRNESRICDLWIENIFNFANEEENKEYDSIE